MPGVTPGLTLSRLAFILEMSLSTLKFKTNFRVCYCLRAGKGAKVSPDVTRLSLGLIGMQGSNIFDGFSKIDQGRSLLACTTRMFEILKMKQSEAHLIRICPNHSVHQNFRTHILAASYYSLVTSQDGFPSRLRGQLCVS